MIKDTVNGNIRMVISLVRNIGVPVAGGSKVTQMARFDLKNEQASMGTED